MDVDDARPARLLFLSPHLDDAVFSCGELIASAEKPVVATLFAGRPSTRHSHTTWDAACGFRPGDDVVGLRREEDRAALGKLRASPIWLDHRDDQYACSPNAATLLHGLEKLLKQVVPRAVFFPLGLFHSDHLRTGDAVLPLITRFGAMGWYAYEDAIYRRIPDLAERRIASLRDAGFEMQRHAFGAIPATHAQKRQAIACYRSQLKGLRSRPAYRDALAPEAYWRISGASAA